MSFKWLKRYMPRSLYGRAALIIILPVVVVQLVASFVFLRNHLRDITTQMTLTTTREIAVVLDLVDEAESAVEVLERADLLMAALLVGFDPVSEAAVPTSDDVGIFDYSAHVVRQVVRDSLPQTLAVEMPDNRVVRIYVATRHGPVEITFNRRRVTAAAPHQLILTMLFFGLLMTAIAFLYMRNQLRPITRLANAAEAFGRGRIVPYSPTGAIEVRAAGGAFLDMRARIERQIEQRTMLLSGVSHDLRTPLTRMKLGLALLDEEDAAPLLRDVDEMQRLVDAFLDFTKGASEGEPEKVDIKAMVTHVVEDAKRAGKDVNLVEAEGEGKVMVNALAMRRAVENLLGNATQYGTKAEVSVVLTEKSMRIRVEDDGPGIPEAKRVDAVKPFSRLDPSRNQNRGGGVGLGLAIVNDVARAHGGVLRLGKSDRLGGLRADIVIGR